jgi:hypothetical protein
LFRANRNHTRRETFSGHTADASAEPKFLVRLRQSFHKPVRHPRHQSICRCHIAAGPVDEKEKEMAMLKKIMIGAGLATILATSAMAQSYQPEVGSGNITPNTKQQYSNTMRSGANAFAFERSAPHHLHHHNQNLDRD